MLSCCACQRQWQLMSLACTTMSLTALGRRLTRLRTDGAFRKSTNSGVVFGAHLLQVLLRTAPHAIQHIYHCGLALPALAPLLPPSAHLTPVPASLVASASGLENAPMPSLVPSLGVQASVATVFSLPTPLAAPALLAASPRALVLDRVSDPGNLGTILRTCAALQWAAVLSRGCCDPFNDKVLRASRGATFSVPWCWLPHGSDDGPDALASAQPPAASTLTVLLLPQATRELSAHVASSRAFQAVRCVVGSEAHGLSSAWLAAPQTPFQESIGGSSSALVHARLGPLGQPDGDTVLNASIAAALAMYALTP